MTQSPIDHILKPVSRFIHQEFTGGIVSFMSVIAAIIWANSPLSESYRLLWDTQFTIGIDGQGFVQPLHVWIKDGLMALFFFVTGLELKRDFMAGALSSVKKASLPMVTAMGGMLVPALIYILFNHGRLSSLGWGIPMVTDISFALGLSAFSFSIMPLFALANAGMHIGGDFLSLIANPVSLWVSVGLVLEKFIGVFSFTSMMIKLRFATLPQRPTWRYIVGFACPESALPCRFFCDRTCLS